MTRVGLIGYCCPTGLGYENRRMWAGLAPLTWLVWPHDLLGWQGLLDVDVSAQIGGRLNVSAAEAGNDTARALAVDAFLDEVDVVIVAERPFPDDLFTRARARGVKTVLLVNPEWRLGYSWSEADVVVARTAFCKRVIEQVTGRRDVVFCPCPLDIETLPFHLRTEATWGLYSHGWGGVHDRKGWPTVRGLLQAAPHAQVVVRSQRPLPDSPAPVLPAVATPADLYDPGGDAVVDVAIQPSRFEGVGLAVLEAMACGLPVLTTDAAPMNEYIHEAYEDLAELCLLPVAHTQLVPMWAPWRSHIVEPSAIAYAMEALQVAPLGTVEALSRRGRGYVERRHGVHAWATLREAVTV